MLPAPLLPSAAPPHHDASPPPPPPPPQTHHLSSRCFTARGRNEPLRLLGSFRQAQTLILNSNSHQRGPLNTRTYTRLPIPGPAITQPFPSIPPLLVRSGPHAHEHTIKPSPSLGSSLRLFANPFPPFSSGAVVHVSGTRPSPTGQDVTPGTQPDILVTFQKDSLVRRPSPLPSMTRTHTIALIVAKQT